jgi:hypothetical protein
VGVKGAMRGWVEDFLRMELGVDGRKSEEDWK